MDVSQLRTLSVAAKLDASGYAAGAAQKVSADQAMSASGAEVVRSSTQVDQKIAQSGDVLSRLSRQYVEGFATSQRFNTGLNSLGRGIETGRIQMAQAIPILEGMYQKLGMQANAAKIAERGYLGLSRVVDDLNAKLRAQTAAANDAATALQRTAVNDNVAFRGQAQFQTANLAAQFQDIGVTAAMGMNPLMIALQQGTQISAVLGPMGATGAVRGLAAAFSSIINPVSLVTIGVVGLTAAAIQFFGEFLSGSEDSEEALQKQQELIARVASRWGESTPALKAYNDELQRQKDIGEAVAASQAAAGQQYTPVRDQISDLRVGIADVVSMTQAAGVETANIAKLQSAFNDLVAKVGDSTAVGADATRVQTELADLLRISGIPIIGEYATRFGELASQIAAASSEAEKFGVLQKGGVLFGADGKTSILSPLNPLDGFQRTPFQTEEEIMYERGRRAREEEAGRLGGIGIPIPTPRPNDIERLDSMPSGADYLAQQRERIAALQLELSLVGQTADVRMRAISSMQAENEIRRLGIDLHGAEAEAIRGNAAALTDLQIRLLQEQEAKQRSIQAQERFVQSLSFGFDAVGDAILGIVDGSEKAEDALKRLIVQLALAAAQGWLLGQGPLAGFFQPGGLIGAGSGSMTPAASPFTENITGGAFFGAIGDATSAVQTATGSLTAAAGAIKSLESGSMAGNYSAVGPWVGGDRAYGAYQVMGANIPSWTQGALGHTLSPSQFLADKAAQDAVFSKYFGENLQKYGFEDAASIWHSGRPLDRAAAAGATDGYMATTDYVAKANAQFRKLTETTARLDTTTDKAVQGMGNMSSGFDAFGRRLASAAFPSAPSGGGGLLGGLFGGGLPSLDFMNAISPAATANILGGIGGLYAMGGVFYGGNVIPFADGGSIVRRPTHFPMAGGRTGLMGEAGPEAIMPLQRGRDGRLGVALNGGSAPSRGDVRITVNVEGANGDAHVVQLVRQGVAAGLAEYDRDFTDKARSAVTGGRERNVSGLR